MSLASEFRESLKTVDSEEILDLYIFRPLSFVFVKLIFNTNITPNQISIVALVFGILSGILYGFGTYTFLLLGSASFFICNTLDCMDGQLARLKKNGTRIGRVIDGFIDYATSVSVFLGLGFAMTYVTGNPIYSWLLTVAAGISKAVQNMLFDHYRNVYLEHVYSKVSDIDSEIREYTDEWNRLSREKGNLVEKMLVKSYIDYSKLQKKITRHENLTSTAEHYKRKNQLLLRLWSWIGSTTHMMALIAWSIFNRIDIYLILTVTLGNFIMLILLLWQKRALQEFKNH